MSRSINQISIILEVGTKRVFASAVDWPGWTRVGRNEEAALQSQFEYGARYGRAIRKAKLGFAAPGDQSNLVVVERLTGNTTTDFGAPDVAATSELTVLDDSSLKHLTSILNASWDSLLAASQAATGRPLRKGPRGGGRELVEIVRHVVDAHSAYLRRINWSGQPDKSEDVRALIKAVKGATTMALTAAAAIKVPQPGPRGGTRWYPRYFARRAAWHILDHVWEIEDRLEN